MAGEIVFRSVNTKRYEEARAALAELRSTRKLSGRSVGLLRLAMKSVLPERDHLRSGRERIERVLEASDLDPRDYLSPDGLTDVMWTLFMLYCCDRAGYFNLVDGGGTNWLVLERGVAPLYDDDWFQQLLEGTHPQTYGVDIPAETSSFVIPHELLGELDARLESILLVPGLETVTTSELTGLRKLRGRAAARGDVGLLGAPVHGTPLADLGLPTDQEKSLCWR